MNSLQNEKSRIPVIASSVSLQDVSDTNCSGVGSDFKLQSLCVSSVNESPVLSATSVKLEPDRAGEPDKLESNMNTIFVRANANFTSRLKLDEEPQPDKAEDKDPLSCTSNIVISDCVSLSFIKFEDILVENELQSHITGHLSENIEPRETPRFNMLIGTNDEHFHSDDVISAMNYLQATDSSVSQDDVSVSNLNECHVLSTTSVKLEPDEAGEADKLESNMNKVFVSTNFTSGVQLDEKPQPDEAEDEDPLSCTSNIIISECISLSNIKLENLLVENDGIYQCDQKEFNEFDKLWSHKTGHLCENIVPREAPGFIVLIGTNDEHFHSDDNNLETVEGNVDIQMENELSTVKNPIKIEVEDGVNRDLAEERIGDYIRCKTDKVGDNVFERIEYRVVSTAFEDFFGENIKESYEDIEDEGANIGIISSRQILEEHNYILGGTVPRLNTPLPTM